MLDSREHQNWARIGSHNQLPTMLECAVLFMLVVVVSGHPQPSHRDGHPCTVDVLLGPTDVPRVASRQSANPVVVWLGLVSRVVGSSWSRGAFVL